MPPKAVCQWDGKCFRRNPTHFTDYDHPTQYPNGYPGTQAAPASHQVVAVALASPQLSINVPVAPTNHAATVVPKTHVAVIDVDGPIDTPKLPVSANPFAAFLGATSTNNAAAKRAPSATLVTVTAQQPIAVAPPAPATPPVVPMVPPKREREESTEPLQPITHHRAEGPTRQANYDAPTSPLPSLLREVLGSTPSLDEYVYDRSLLYGTALEGATRNEHHQQAHAPPNYPVRTLADLYHVALPEAEMREVLLLGKAAMVAVPSTIPAMTTSFGGGDVRSPLDAFPGVRLVGPFEALWRLMRHEDAGNDGRAEHPPLMRSQFPSYEALWSHWRFRHDPPEALTFLVTAEIYHRHNPTGQRLQSVATAGAKKTLTDATKAAMAMHAPLVKDPCFDPNVAGVQPNSIHVYENGRGLCHLGQGTNPSIAAAVGCCGALDITNGAATATLPTDTKALLWDLLVPRLSEKDATTSPSARFVSLSFYRDQWDVVAVGADNTAAPPADPATTAAKKAPPYTADRLVVLQGYGTMPALTGTKFVPSLFAAVPPRNDAACPLSHLQCPLAAMTDHAYKPMATVGDSSSHAIGSCIATVVELLKPSLQKALGQLMTAASTMVTASSTPFNTATVVDGWQLHAGSTLLKACPPLSDAAIAAEGKLRAKTSLGKTCHKLGVIVPYDKRTEVGYREPQTELDQHVKMAGYMAAAASEGLFATHHTGKKADGSVVSSSNGGGNSFNNKPDGLTRKQRDTLDEELRCVDIGNDECDFGYGLEVGLNMLYHCGGCTCYECRLGHVLEGAADLKKDVALAQQLWAACSSGNATVLKEAQMAAQQRAVEVAKRHLQLQRAAVTELLWHCLRTLDTAYNLLNRPISRHNLRCIVRLLIAGNGRFEVAVAGFM